MSEQTYEVSIRPARYFGIFRESPGLRVTVAVRHPYRTVGEEVVKGYDEGKARKVAARLIAADQAYSSKVMV